MESNHPIRGYEPRPCTSIDCEGVRGGARSETRSSRARVEKPRWVFPSEESAGPPASDPYDRSRGRSWIRLELNQSFACRASTSGRAKRRWRESNPHCPIESRGYLPLYDIDRNDGRVVGVGDDLVACTIWSVALTPCGAVGPRFAVRDSSAASLSGSPQHRYLRTVIVTDNRQPFGPSRDRLESNQHQSG